MLNGDHRGLPYATAGFSLPAGVKGTRASHPLSPSFLPA
jgi:hypothetical protein